MWVGRPVSESQRRQAPARTESAWVPAVAPAARPRGEDSCRGARAGGGLYGTAGFLVPGSWAGHLASPSACLVGSPSSTEPIGGDFASLSPSRLAGLPGRRVVALAVWSVPACLPPPGASERLVASALAGRPVAGLPPASLARPWSRGRFAPGKWRAQTRRLLVAPGRFGLTRPPWGLRAVRPSSCFPDSRRGSRSRPRTDHH